MALASTESLLLDNINLNDGAPWTVLQEPAFTFTPAKKKLTWATSSQSDGSAPAGGEDHYENAEMTFSLIMSQQADADTARAVMSSLTSKLQEATKTFGGLPLTWTPSNSTTPLTFYVVQAEHDEMPTARTDAYFSTGPEMNVHLFLRPFGYVGEQLATWSYSEPFLWDSISGGRWRFDSGSGTMSVQPLASRLTCSTTALKEVFLPWTTFGSTTALRFGMGNPLDGTSGISLFAKRQSSTQYIRVTASGSGQALRIIKKDGGDTQVATTSITLAASTIYWMTMQVDEDDITGAIYTDGDNPLNGTNPALATVTYTLTGGEVTTFGSTKRGNLGIRVQPGSTTTDWIVDHFDARDMTQVRSTEPSIGLEIRDVAGHVSAEGRMVLTEAASPNSKTWRHVEWGRESKDYDPTLGWPYMLTADSLDTSFAGDPTSGFPGAFDPDATGTNVILSKGLSQTVAVTACGTGGLQHLGTFKVKARVSGTAGARVRFKRQLGDGPFEENLWSNPLPESVFGTWFELDLGTITIERQSSAVVQSWKGRIDAISPDTEAGTVAINYLLFIPVEAYGKARAPLQPLDASVFTAFDHFNQATGNLDSKVMGSSNIWRSTVGQAGDFTLPVSGEHRAERSTLAAADLNSGHYAIAKTAANGVLNMTDMQMQADVQIKITPSTGTDLQDKMRYGVFIRCPFVSGAADPANWLMAVVQTVSVADNSLGGASDYNHGTKLVILKRKANGTPSVLGTVKLNRDPQEKVSIALTADTTGLWQAYVWPAGTRQPGKPLKSGQDSDLATGGALASGGAGIYDCSTMANNVPNLLLVRVFDNVALFAATPDAVCFPTKQLEIRSDATRRQALSGTSTGKVPRYQGKRFFLEPAGDVHRINRIFVKWRETDVDEVADIQATDAAILQAYVAPRYLYPPGGGA